MSKAKQYRKKPVVVEAMQIGVDSWRAIADWCGGRIVKYNGGSYAFIVVETLEGEMRGGAGDYIIKGVKGEFYPCKPDIFERTYERVS